MKGIAYRIPVPRSRAQGTSNADRPACAMVAAAASIQRGEAPLGVLREKSQAEAYSIVQQALMDEYGVQPAVLRSWVESLNGSMIGDRAVPLVIGGMTLEQYQIDTIARMTPAGGGLALGCGIGKTLAACAYAHAIGATSIIVVCPLNAFATWKKYTPLLPVKPTIQSMDSVHHLLGTQQVDLIIFDEAHKQGHFSAKRTKDAHTLRLRAKSALTLTGTLLHAGIIKALSVQDLAIPGAARFSNRWAAGEHFHCLVRKAIGGRTVTEIGKPPEAMREEFHAYLSRYTVALTPDSASVAAVLKLPGQDVMDVPIGQPWRSIEQETADFVLEAVNRGEDVPTAAAAAHAMCAAGAQAKADWVLQNIGADPVVLFAHYTATLDLMEQELKDAGITYVRVDGAVTGDDRIQAQDDFQSGRVQVFLGQMSAAGISMDLFRTPYSIALDHPWKAEDYAQALARTHRRGQAQHCTHWDLYANKLQQRVVARLRSGEAFNAETAEWQEIKASC